MKKFALLLLLAAIPFLGCSPSSSVPECFIQQCLAGTPGSAAPPPDEAWCQNAITDICVRGEGNDEQTAGWLETCGGTSTELCTCGK